jgi:hypothetical protein
VGADQLRAALATLRHLVAVLEADQRSEKHQLTTDTV